MFLLRIHSLDSPSPSSSPSLNLFPSLSPSPIPEEGCSAAAAAVTTSATITSPLHLLSPPETQSSADDQESGPVYSSSTIAASRNPRKIHVIKGIIHLYRNPPHPLLSSSSSSFNLHYLPPGRGTLLFVLAVPNRLSPDDFLRFCGPSADHSSIRFIRNDAVEDRYSVLVKFDDQKSADAFYLELSGWPFSSGEGEVCHILFLVSVEYTESAEVAGTPPAGFTELPTCPVCLERLDQDITGIIATTCDHSFQCSCISKWANSSCSVCHFCQERSEKPACSICGTCENLWICVICGFVGCGRYKEGHAIRHWKDTQHCYSLDLETQRVWDYVGDSYVHRLNQSKSDDKLDKVKSSRSTGDNCESFTCDEDLGINGALLNSKVEVIVEEYNRLLESQLESQRQYYETLLEEAKVKREQYVSEAVEKAVSLKMEEIQLNIENIIKEKKIVAEDNEIMVMNQNHWRERIKEIEDREKETLKSKDDKIRDLEEEIRDFTVFIEAQKVLSSAGDASEIQGGTLLPVPSPAPSSSSERTRRSSRANRRRR